MIDNKKSLQATLKKENQIYDNADFNRKQEEINKDAFTTHIIRLKNKDQKNTCFKILDEKVKDESIRAKEEESFDKMMLDKALLELQQEKFKNEAVKKNEYEKLIQIKYDNERKQKDLKKEKQDQKLLDVDLQEKYLAEELRKQKKREDEFEERLRRIQDKMDKMADTIVKKDKIKIVAEERRLLQLQMDRNLKLLKEEQEKKQFMFQQNKIINEQLVDQMDEKQRLKNDQVKADKRFKDKLIAEINDKESLDEIRRQEHKISLMNNKD
mmetsp:Transcript_61885/g.52435  ORF Transcript_61885/g.52435 Transcript_61885/m.52435 type:complete len:269 (+) Transcript_61885:509-1315(+)